MIGGQWFYTPDRMDNQLSHGSIVVIPAGMVVLADGLRQLRVGNLGAIELPLEDDQNGITIPGDVLLPICLVRHLHELLPEMMRL